MTERCASTAHRGRQEIFVRSVGNWRFSTDIEIHGTDGSASSEELEWPIAFRLRTRPSIRFQRSRGDLRKSAR